MQSIKTLRIHLGLSQKDLAERARVSVAFLRLVENRKGNPSLAVLDKIGATLGMELQWKPTPPRWGALTHWGVPLQQVKEKSVQSITSVGEFLHELKRALLFFEESSDPFSREHEAVLATVWAITSHYPSYLKEEVLQTHLSRLSADYKPSLGRMIKLKRIALAHLCKKL